jgi:hypothetical protein
MYTYTYKYPPAEVHLSGLLGVLAGACCVFRYAGLFSGIVGHISTTFLGISPTRLKDPIFQQRYISEGSLLRRLPPPQPPKRLFLAKATL